MTLNRKEKIPGFAGLITKYCVWHGNIACLKEIKYNFVVCVCILDLKLGYNFLCLYIQWLMIPLKNCSSKNERKGKNTFETYRDPNVIKWPQYTYIGTSVI